MGELAARILGASLGGVKVKAWLAILAVAAGMAFVIVRIADNAFEDTLDTAAGKGRAEAESDGKSVTLQQNKDANDAEVEVQRGGSAARDGCVSGARGDASGCERFGN